MLPASVLARLEDLSVLVIGDAILDAYLHGRTSRLCREAPVPVVDLDQRVEQPGGAANVAMNLRALGAGVTLLSVVGDDPAGAALRRQLAGAGVEVERLAVQPGRRTLTKQRVLAGEQLLVRLDDGDAGPVDPGVEGRLLDGLDRLAARHDAVVVSDYAAGVVGRALLARLRRLQAEAPALLTVDARRLAPYRNLGATVVKPNYQEAAALLGIRPAEGWDRRVALLEQRGERLRGLLGARVVAVTLDTDGALLFEADRPPYRTYARPVAAAAATGAGDTFASVLTLALAAGAEVPAAGELASAAAAIVVTRPGTAVCTRADLRGALTGAARRVTDPAGLAELVAEHRRAGRRIVFTCGCFDLLHAGHVACLNRAKALGDVLVVGVNADASVRRLKGPDRPVNPLEDRLAVLAGLSCIDHLVPFEADTPVQLLEALRPDVFVKGGDYHPDTVPEAELVHALGGRVQIVPYLDGYSTAGVVQRIRAGGGRAGAAAVSPWNRSATPSAPS
jgi:D-beta-D-heptose 7-phosphate kinase/D-beta-D-heptose 1-phosphate adenosyltransferase